MRVINFFDSDRKSHWLNEIKRGDWGAAHFLHELLSGGTFFDAAGEKSKVLLLIDGDELISFCTYSEKDDIQPTDLTPWMGFVYTFPEHRGHRYVGLLMDEIERLAGIDGVSDVYISTNHIGLYEKYGCEFKTEMKDMNGELSRVYVKHVSNILNYRLMTIDDYEAAYDLWIKCGNGLNDKDDSRDGIEKYLKRNPNTSYVAELDKKVVGVILCGHDGRRGIIQHACVSPDYRRMGIGKELVNLALAALKKEGINKVLLVAFKKNEDGNAFWESQGFSLREDLNYRNKALVEMIRIDPEYLEELAKHEE